MNVWTPKKEYKTSSESVKSFFVEGLLLLARIWDIAMQSLFPVFCLGCGSPEKSLCSWCLSEVVHQEVNSDDLAEEISVSVCAVAARYSGIARRCVLAAKHDSYWCPDIWITTIGDCLAENIMEKVEYEGVLYIVPAPSGWKRRLAGRYVAGEIAHAIALEISHKATVCNVDCRIDVVMALRLSLWTRTQAGKDGQNRRVSRLEAVSSACQLPVGARVIVVDDVIATGATLQSCVQTLRAQGAHVVAIAAACLSS